MLQLHDKRIDSAHVIENYLMKRISFSKICFFSFIEGRPVYIVRLGSMDFKGLLKTVGEDGFVKQV